MTERQELGSLEAMLFAHAEPVETARLADALRLDADEVAELLRIKKGSAYEVIRRINAEQEARGRVVIRGRVRSDVFDALYFPEVD